MFKKIDFLKYKNLKFKKILKKDLEILRLERNSIQIRNKMINQKIISKSDHISWFKKTINQKDSDYFNIFYNDELIGSGSIKDINKKDNNCTWGFYIFRKFRGPYGVLSEIKIIERAFKKHKIYKLYGHTLKSNLPILKIHKFCGFKIEGVLKNHIKINGKKIDLILTSLFQADWQKKIKKIQKMLNI